MKLLGTILSTIGKPFYFLLSKIILAILFVFYSVGHSFLFIGKMILKIKLPKLTLPKFKLKKTKLPHMKKRFLLPVVVVISFSFIFYLFILKGLPSPKELITRQQEVSTKIYDRNKILLYTIYKDKNRTLISLDQVPQHVRLATLAAEDAEFYSHPGFSVRGMLRALNKNIREGKLQGGSTITQQLVKNALLSSEKTFVRKLREIILSVGVEMNFSKDQILEMYLNEVSFGGTAYGIQEASNHYFGKNVDQLNLSEAALLAGLPQSPTKYSPFGPNPELAFSKQREVLYLMKINKFITEDEENMAITQPISFAPNKTTILAPHFVMFVKNQLAQIYGDEMVEKGGLRVVTTLDYQIQALTEKIVSQELNSLKKLNVGNGAVVVLNPETGEVLAMVGSKDYFDTKMDGNVNVTTRARQPGSSIKVINYAYVLSNGLTLSSTIDDSPITFNVPGTIPYSPKNYDGKFKGKMTLRSALAQSRNVPAVKILASYGVSKMVELGQKMGITTWTDPSRFGLSLTLGAGEVKLIDLALVYATIANVGEKPEIKTISSIINYKDKDLFPSKNRFNQEEPVEVVDPRVAYLLIDVLKDNIARSPAFGTNSTLVIPNHPEVAVKTGTSNDLRDNITVGFNQNYLVAVWVGNNDNSPMSRVASGITGASPIWNKIMRSLLANTKSVEWPVPEGLVKVPCFGKMEWYLEEKVMTCPKVIEPAASTEHAF
ncbi:transglycosylase domain-containing protein [Candidatus Microgenomates bacterium]|nr:transglycosylase domain-containing protein [Candidatus Microgenomates bacterium]